MSLLSTFPAIFLLPIVGRKTLLLSSIFGIGASTVLVGYGLDTPGMSTMAIAGVFGFVASFGVGLGPIPFIVSLLSTSSCSPFWNASALDLRSDKSSLVISSISVLILLLLSISSLPT